ncbi:hypothetical protein JYT76_03245 [Olleya sp. AH-315-F22]|nr:hypothetical protein [Olleya sp. AH-315-F22]
MAKWGYKTEKIDTWTNKGLEEILNMYGEDGYELVLIDKKGLYIFKKQIEN